MNSDDLEQLIKKLLAQGVTVLMFVLGPTGDLVGVTPGQDAPSASSSSQQSPRARPPLEPGASGDGCSRPDDSGTISRPGTGQNGATGQGTRPGTGQGQDTGQSSAPGTGPGTAPGQDTGQSGTGTDGATSGSDLPGAGQADRDPGGRSPGTGENSGGDGKGGNDTGTSSEPGSAPGDRGAGNKQSGSAGGESTGQESGGNAARSGEQSKNDRSAPCSSTTAPGSSTTAPGSSTPAPGSSTTAPGSSTTAPGSVRSGDTTAGQGATENDSAGQGTTAAEKLGWGQPVRTDDFSQGVSGWSVYDGPGHAGNGRRTPDAVSFQNGVLKITGDAQGNTAGMAWVDGSQKYGRWEGRVRAPASDPSYNALLLLWPTAENFPEGGEIDFMEMMDPSRQKTNIFVHYGADNSQVEGSADIDATTWHNWAVEWTPERITAYVDGTKWWETTDRAVQPPGPMHLCIQLDWFPKGGSAKESTMEVAWVRQYTLNGGSVAS